MQAAAETAAWKRLALANNASFAAVREDGQPVWRNGPLLRRTRGGGRGWVYDPGRMAALPETFRHGASQVACEPSYERLNFSRQARGTGR